MDGHLAFPIPTFSHEMIPKRVNDIAGADPAFRREFAEEPWVILSPSPGAARLKRSPK
jgi:hypothetical protein